jgi:hypothetical protein
VFDQIKCFQNKLRLWKIQFQKNDFSHFPTLSQCKVTNTEKYCTALSFLKSEFSSWFQDIKSSETLLKTFSTPFSMDVEDATWIKQMELIDMQCNSDLEEKYKNVGLLDFYSKYIEKEKFPAIQSHAVFMMSLSGSTYVCEQFFFRMKNVESCKDSADRGPLGELTPDCFISH